jgi:poly-gamma-glutamate synthesis protein (capsule biosynthesis protein)
MGKGYITLMAVGDIMLGRSIGELIITEGFESPFRYTAETLKLADLTIGNLECPISERGEAVEKTYAFRAPLAAASSLAHAGFDLVSLANNHALDYGHDALEDTQKLLKEHQIRVVGAGMDAAEAYAPVFVEINGLKIAFLAFVDVPTLAYNYLEWEARADQPGVAWAHEERVREGVQSASQQADIVIVMVHNGYELVSRVNGYQQATAHLAIDSGASLVIGSHPHVLQRLETYKDGLIAYSMGNFVFDNFLFPPNYSAILSVELNKDGIQSFEMIDVVIQLNGVPRIMPYHFDD